MSFQIPERHLLKQNVTGRMMRMDPQQREERYQEDFSADLEKTELRDPSSFDWKLVVKDGSITKMLVGELKAYCKLHQISTTKLKKVEVIQLVRDHVIGEESS